MNMKKVIAVLVVYINVVLVNKIRLVASSDLRIVLGAFT